MQDLYNEDANIMKQAAQEKENLIWLIDLAMIAMTIKYKKPIDDEPQAFNKAWNHLNMKSQR